MRTLGVVLLLTLPALAGCINASDDAPGATLTAAGLIPVIEVPEGATLVDEGARILLRWADVELPFKANFTVPKGATIVRAIGTLESQLPVGATMWNEQTGRRRCNTDRVDLWDLPITKVSTCSGLAAIDPAGAVWVVSVSGAALTAAFVDVAFETTPLDGIVSQLDLTKLSMPTYDLVETEFLMVPSFDGTPMRVEVTLPVGEGPWPTIIGSSPYNGQYGRDVPAMWAYFTHDWAKRGYAIVNIDVRGFGLSGGCVEVWGTNEQKDQAFFVDWVAEQGWSDGHVGFYGQSYVATTPVEAAVQSPAALDAIVIVAPVMNAYYDWHFGGVPNGESSGSPVAYQVLTDGVPVPATPNPGNVPGWDPNLDPYTNPQFLAEGQAKGVCDPTLAARANDPRAIYDSFYEERNFSARVKDVKAAVLYTQGFEDSNVKSAMIPWWFNDIESPKLGLFGHWVHQHPTRADEEVLFLGWMDQYVKGKDLGFEKVPNVDVVVDAGNHRLADVWPPAEDKLLALQTDLGAGTLAEGATGPDVKLAFTPVTPGATVTSPDARSFIVLEMPIENDIALAGLARVAITGTMDSGGNGYFSGTLIDEGPDGAHIVTYGMFNLAHFGGHDTYETLAPNQRVTFELPFLPTEHIFRAGHTLRLKIETVSLGVGDVPIFSAENTPPAVFTLSSGEATQLMLPTVDPSEYKPLPATATP